MAAYHLTAWALVAPAGASLAIVPAGDRPGLFQVLLAFLPEIIGSLLLGGAMLAALWTVFRRRRLRFRLTASAAVVLIELLAVLLWAGWPLVRGRGRPSSPTTRPESVAPWSTFMCNAERTGHTPGRGGPVVGEKIWTFRDGRSRAPFAAPAAVAGGCVFVGSDSRRLYCLDADTGEIVWTFAAAHELFASPAVADGRVFLGEGLHHHNDARVHCLDSATGEKLWEFQTSSHVEFGPTVRDGRVYFGAGEDGVYCLDADTGRKLWRYGGVHVDMSPAVIDRAVFFGNVYGKPYFYRVDPEDGRLIWKSPAPCGVCGSPSTDGRRVYFGLGNGTFEMSHAKPLGAVCCLSVEDGRVRWTTAEVTDSVLTTIALWRDRAYFGSRDGRLYCVDANTGRVHWAFDAGEPVLSSPAIADGRVYFGCDDGVVRCVDATSGEELWRYDTSRAAFNTDARVVGSPAIGNGRVYVGSMNFLFFCLGDPKAGAGPHE